MLNWYRAGLSDSRVNGVLNETIKIPTLMIWGEHDDAFGLDLTYDTEKLVENFTMRYISDSSHWVQQDTPERVNELIMAWLKGKNS